MLTRFSRRRRRWLAVAAAAYAVTALALQLGGCGRAKPAATALRVSAAIGQTSPTCRSCHEEIYAAWARSDHGLANRTVHPVDDAKALAALARLPEGAAANPEMILGHKPLWQPLIPGPGNRWQPHELAYDPEREEWFNVFGTEHRHAGEWGHWTGRGMNWNSMCAQCHMTGFEKKYDEATDTYRSTWVEHGVGCIQCHGPMPTDHGKEGAPKRAITPFQGDRGRMMQTCAPCHARNEPLTDEFQPGDAYHDHYRITLPVQPGVFYADGQQRDEDFNWTSVLLSRMGHAGVTCLDCHDPHSNRTLLPASTNALCLQCHAAPGRVQPNGVRAVPIDPLAHSHHQEGSTGNTCVGCHMPTTSYMQRAPRHDHGWLIPDPLLTKELGIPNACTRCHTDQTVDWAIERADAWYGERLQTRQRTRARAVAAAHERKPGATDALLALLAKEDIPAWRATYLTLLASLPDESGRAAAAARASLGASDPLERSAAVGFLTPDESARDALRPLLRDPVRLVRLDAAWALSHELAPGSPERAELDAYLGLSTDQPAGRLRRGADLANRGRLIEAEADMRRAADWDPGSAGIRESVAMVLAAQNRLPEAAAEFMRGAEIEPNNATYPFRAALAFAEAGHVTQAESALRQAVTRDPAFARAWYNLGLLLAQQERLAEAASALGEAEQLEPTNADFAHALGTVLLRAGDRPAAREAARRALRADPNHVPAAQLLSSLEAGRGR